jgi:Zn-finger nucleic acid-binding protein
MSTATGPMACPIDGTTLTMSERSGIEIDYCPTCRGVWLDRGELDKIIQRNGEATAAASPPPPQAAPAPQAPYPQHQQPSPWGHQQPGQYGYKPHKRRKSFLEELFD